jgi:class I fructose-bisphosphate aldolase/fructose-bisphosphate aldolase/2-amino-3,7-dideoxy-D-threo-hept-6-ulosonate synthase
MLVLPFDHPIYFGVQPGTEDPRKLLDLAREHGATAVLATAGALRAALDAIGDLGVIMRVDATLSHLSGPDTVMHLLHSAEEAAALGADMVVLNCYIGTGDIPAESALLEKLATVSAECEQIGMPICAEIIPRVPSAGPAQKMPTSEDLAMAIRLGLEYGCDVVKTVYNGDPEGYARAVASGHLPVIMAGGPKTSGELDFLKQVHEAMTHGASGVAIGRRVWGSEHPVAAFKAIKAIVFDGATAEQAVALYRKSKKG